MHASFERLYRAEIDGFWKSILAGDHTKALKLVAKLLARSHSHPKAQHLKGAMLLIQDKPEEAIDWLLRAVSALPKDAEVYDHLAVAHAKLGKRDLALEAFKKSLELNPGRPDVWVNAGKLAIESYQFTEAEQYFLQALRLKSDHFAAVNNLSTALLAQDRYVEAGKCIRRTLELKPDSGEAWLNYAVLHILIGKVEDALPILDRIMRSKYYKFETHSNYLFAISYLGAIPPAQFTDMARDFGTRLETSVTPFKQWKVSFIADKRIRVGLVSGDLINHPVGYFLEGVLAKSASANIDFFAYSNRMGEDDLTARIKPYFSKWTPIYGMPDEAVACLIHDDAIDVLIDLSGHTAHNRLPVFARKPAPLQVSWLGYFATTGLKSIDYILGDRWVLPYEDQPYYTEKLWLLPDSYLCFTPPHQDIPIAEPPAIQNGYVTFCSFNNLSKMNDQVVALWADLLRAIENSKLFLKTGQLGDTTVRQKTLDRFAAHGIARDRLILEGASPREELLASYNRADIALDPFPYPGGTTTVESLWMGVPVISNTGDRFLSRVGKTILETIGHPEWVAQDREAYIVKAVELSNDLSRLCEIRATLKTELTKSPLCNAEEFIKNFEEAIRGMWVARLQELFSST